MNPALVTLHGNVTRNPEAKALPNGNTVALFGVACSRKWKVYKDNGVEDWAEEVSFFDVQCFGRLADNVLDTVTKGMQVLIWGRLKQRSWEADGHKRSKVEVIAEELGVSLQFATVEVHKTGAQRTPMEQPSQGQARRSTSRQPAGSDYEQRDDGEAF